MLNLVLSYHQVLPDFIDFLIPFGKQRGAHDFHFTCLRQRTRLSTRSQGLSIPELGWSGRDIQLCYNLKSVEYSKESEDNPWSIRHCAVSHTFDVENARTSWILIKGNDLMQQRITQASSVRGLPELREVDSLDKAFAASLVVHTILCDWAAEDWRWYINFLEEKFKPIERRTMRYEVDGSLAENRRALTFNSRPQHVQTDATEQSNLSKLSHFSRKLTSAISLNSNRGILSFSRRNTTQSPDIEMQSPQYQSVVANGTADDDKDDFGQQKFSFRDLQDLHYIDSKVNEADLVIHHVLSMIHQIVSYYDFLFKLRDFPRTISDGCGEELSHFKMHISGIEMDLKMQASRLKALQHSTTDCQSLVCFAPITSLTLLTCYSYIAF